MLTFEKSHCSAAVLSTPPLFPPHDDFTPSRRFSHFTTFCFSKVSSTVLYTGWCRVIGCLKLQVFFRKRATNCRALWWKETCQDKVSYASSPPCTFIGLICAQTTYKKRQKIYRVLHKCHRQCQERHFQQMSHYFHRPHLRKNNLQKEAKDRNNRQRPVVSQNHRSVAIIY